MTPINTGMYVFNRTKSGLWGRAVFLLQLQNQDELWYEKLAVEIVRWN